MDFDLDKFLAIVHLVAPTVLSLVPGGAVFAPLVAAGIGEAQQLHNASGADKKAHVLALVQDAATATNTARPGTVDPALLNEAVAPAIDVIVDMTKRLAAIEQVQAPTPLVGVPTLPPPPPAPVPVQP